MIKKNRKAFTLMEIIIAMGLLVIAVLSLFLVNQASNKSSMDAYYESMAFSLAREPIEIFRGLGYENCSKICKNPTLSPSLYKVGEMMPIEYNPTIELQYPAEAEIFQRMIELEEDVTLNNTRFVKITVTVAAKGLSKAEVWLSRKAVTLESMIMEHPKW